LRSDFQAIFKQIQTTQTIYKSFNMKSINLIITVLFLAFQLTAQDKGTTTESFTVYGNCGMCKSKIEKAATGVKGVKSATWNQETHQLSVTYNSAKTLANDIKQAVADAGYDSDTHRAKDEVYNNLHGCCQYDRPAEKATKVSSTLKNEKVCAFRVYGNCGMCKRRIEGAVKDGTSVSDASWDSETGNVTIKYDPEKTTEEQLMQKIADAGHDTDKFRAKDETYDGLPGCCQYERAKQ
jgi:outer membrane receptor for ferrienterochelin and colicins